MKVHLIGAAGLALGLAIALIATSRGSDFPTASPAEPAGAAAPTPAAPARELPGDSLMLTVEVRHGSVRVLQALRKPGLKTILPWDWESYVYRWRVLDAAGALLAEGGFEPGTICDDPTHIGRPPHVMGDVVLPHVIYTNVKVPDFAQPEATVEFSRIVGAERVLLCARRVSELGLR